MFKIAVIELKQNVRNVLDMQWGALAGAAFMVMAMAAIQYEERIAPEVHRLSDGWTHAATDFSRKLTSFTL